MAVLKKIRASTLMETLVGTVLIVIIFMIASTILNNLFSNTVKNNTVEIDAYLSEVEYLYLNKKLTLPFEEEFNNWHVKLEQETQNKQVEVIILAVNKQTKKEISRTIED